MLVLTSNFALSLRAGPFWQPRDWEQRLIQAILKALRVMIEGDSTASEIARVLVPVNAHLLAAMAPGWYGAHVLPLLSATASPRSSEQSWDGYLFWGSWSQEMLPGLLTAYLDQELQVFSVLLRLNAALVVGVNVRRVGAVLATAARHSSQLQSHNVFSRNPVSMTSTHW